MDGQPDIVSFEPRPRRRDWWPKAGRGVQGPLTGGGAKTFRSAPPC